MIAGLKSPTSTNCGRCGAPSVQYQDVCHQPTSTYSPGQPTTTSKGRMVASTTTRPSAEPNRVQRLDHLQPPAALEHSRTILYITASLWNRRRSLQTFHHKHECLLTDPPARMASGSRKKIMKCHNYLQTQDSLL